MLATFSLGLQSVAVHPMAMEGGGKDITMVDSLALPCESFVAAFAATPKLKEVP